MRGRSLTSSARTRSVRILILNMLAVAGEEVKQELTAMAG
jgi:hypothetical protein